MGQGISKKDCVATLAMLLLCVLSRPGGQVVAAPCCEVKSDAADEAGRRARAAARSTPHHGQIAAVEGGSIEVVYLPRETRVYLYGSNGQPLSTAKVQGGLIMQVQDKWKQVYRFDYALAYVAVAAAAKDRQDYLATTVDLRKVRDGRMEVDVHLTKLPYKRAVARFSQVFASSLLPPPVTVVALEKVDQPAIARQKVCPVSGAALGSMGDPIKVLVGDKGDKGSLYLCCKNCLARIEEKPEKYLAKAAPRDTRTGP